MIVWSTLRAFSAEEKMGELQKEKRGGVRSRYLTGDNRDAAGGSCRRSPGLHPFPISPVYQRRGILYPWKTAGVLFNAPTPLHRHRARQPQSGLSTIFSAGGASRLRMLGEPTPQTTLIIFREFIRLIISAQRITQLLSKRPGLQWKIVAGSLKLKVGQFIPTYGPGAFYS